MNNSEQYLPKKAKKIAEVSLSVYSVPSKSGSRASGAMMERLPSPSESEVERIFRNWDIGKRVCKYW